MRPIVTDRVAYGLSVGLSVTAMSRAKMAEPIEMQFGLRTRVDPRWWSTSSQWEGQF